MRTIYVAEAHELEENDLIHLGITPEGNEMWFVATKPIFTDRAGRIVLHDEDGNEHRYEPHHPLKLAR